MHFVEDQLEIETGDELCVIRFNCTNENLMKLVHVFNGNDSHHFPETLGEGFNCSYYANIGKPRKLETIYNENVNSKYCFQKNTKFLIDSNRANFDSLNKLNRVVVFELVYWPNEDTANDYKSFCGPISFIYDESIRG